MHKLYFLAFANPHIIYKGTSFASQHSVFYELEPIPKYTSAIRDDLQHVISAKAVLYHL